MRRSDFLRQQREQNGGRSPRFWLYLLLAIPLLCILAYGVYRLPPVYDRLSWRVDNLRTQIRYAINPPEEAVFVPQESQAQVAAVVQATLAALTPEPEATLPPPTPTAGGPTPTLQPTAPPLPQTVILPGVQYEDQHNRWNYCGPANLSMGLTFWGWEGDRDDVGAYVKPSDKDKNVMPYEMADFAITQATGLSALVRSGGEVETIKRLIAGGFPVIVEKGYYERDYTGKLGWLGHYQFVNGYNDAISSFTLQDTYVEDGQDHVTPYEEFKEGWRSFNYLFIVIYPQERQDEVLALLGPWADEAWADRHALEIAQAEAQKLTGIDQFFAWFNQGSSHVNLRQYFDAASAFDFAFGLYASLDLDDTQRPYRIMWYQTGPYWAYYYTGRYHDTINLANTTLIETISEPVLEESLYWRGLAKEALGDVDGAISDLRDAVNVNPNFAPGWDQLARLGVDA